MQAQRVLEPLVLTGRSTAARVAAVEALSMLCFVGSEGAADALHTMHTLWRVVLGGERRQGGGAGGARLPQDACNCQHARCRSLVAAPLTLA